MSQHVLIVMPERAGEVPDAGAVARALGVLEAIPGLSELEAIHHDRIQYVSSFEAYERPCCPRCSQDLYDAWLDVMDSRYGDNFSSGLAWTTPCCGERTTLHGVMRNEGLARFELRARNDHGELTDEHVVALEQALGVPVRVIYRMT